MNKIFDPEYIAKRREEDRKKIIEGSEKRGVTLIRSPNRTEHSLKYILKGEQLNGKNTIF